VRQKAAALQLTWQFIAHESRDRGHCLDVECRLPQTFLHIKHKRQTGEFTGTSTSSSSQGSNWRFGFGFGCGLNIKLGAWSPRQPFEVRSLKPSQRPQAAGSTQVQYRPGVYGSGPWARVVANCCGYWVCWGCSASASAHSPQNLTSASLGMPFGVHIDLITSVANLEVFVCPPGAPGPPVHPQRGQFEQ
jgi:hypothetical protein